MADDMSNVEGGQPAPSDSSINFDPQHNQSFDATPQANPIPEASVEPLVEVTPDSDIAVDSSVDTRSDRPDSRVSFRPAFAGGPSFDSAPSNQQQDREGISFTLARPGAKNKPKPRVGTGGTTSGKSPSGRPHWGRRAAIAVGSIMAGAAVLFGINQAVNSGDDNDPNNSGIVGTTTEVVPTPTSTQEATPTPTVEATPTSLAEAKESPYEFGFSKKIGDVTVQITKKTQERTECPDPNVSSKTAALVPCPPIHEFTVNSDVYPDAEERLKTVFELGIYYAWQHAGEGRTNVTFEDYMTRARNGEDMSVKARGFQGASSLPTEITVSPTDEFFFDALDEPISIVRPWTSYGGGFREVINKDGKHEFHVEAYDFTAMGVDQKDKTAAHWGPGNNIALTLSFLSFPDMPSGNIPQSEINKLGPVVTPLRDTVTKKVNGIPWGILSAN